MLNDEELEMQRRCSAPVPEPEQVNIALGQVEVQQVSDDAEQWALAIHDGEQWVHLGPPGDVCDMHESADRLRRIVAALRERGTMKSKEWSERALAELETKPPSGRTWAVFAVLAVIAHTLLRIEARLSEKSSGDSAQ